jgi:hypothetical protein
VTLSNGVLSIPVASGTHTISIGIAPPLNAS